MSRWKTLREGGEVLGIYRTLPLSRGYRLRMEISRFQEEGEAEISLVAHRGRFKAAEVVGKEGYAIGPGGFEAYMKALTLLDLAEQEIWRRYGEDTIIVIHAATERLHKIYRSRLAPRGYTEAPLDYYADPWPSLVKGI